MSRYKINGTEYIQKPLVLGQVGQLIGVMEGVSFTGTDALSIISALGDKLTTAIAIVLRKDGEALADKDFATMARDVVEIELLQAVQIVTDFFGCNPIQSLATSLNGIADTLHQGATGLASSSASLPPETSPDTTKSSGQSPRNRVVHT